VTEIYSLTEATRHVPALDGKRPASSTIFRWAREGIVKNGVRVRLRYQKIGRRIGIPADALPEFFQALAAADALESPNAATPTPQVPQSEIGKRTRTAAQRGRDIAAAQGRLAKAGII